MGWLCLRRVSMSMAENATTLIVIGYTQNPESILTFSRETKCALDRNAKTRWRRVQRLLAVQRRMEIRQTLYFKLQCDRTLDGL